MQLLETMTKYVYKLELDNSDHANQYSFHVQWCVCTTFAVYPMTAAKAAF